MKIGEFSFVFFRFLEIMRVLIECRRQIKAIKIIEEMEMDRSDRIFRSKPKKRILSKKSLRSSSY